MTEINKDELIQIELPEYEALELFNNYNNLGDTIITSVS